MGVLFCEHGKISYHLKMLLYITFSCREVPRDDVISDLRSFSIIIVLEWYSNLSGEHIHCINDANCLNALSGMGATFLRIYAMISCCFMSAAEWLLVTTEV